MQVLAVTTASRAQLQHAIDDVTGVIHIEFLTTNKRRVMPEA